METDNITNIKYNPSQAMSIDDISKVMYDPNAEMYLKNYEALASIAGDTVAAGNAAENYINSLEFLPGDKSVDKDKVIDEINNMVYADWDNNKSPKNLGRFVSDFSKRIGPSGDIGKAVARNQNRMTWENNEKASLDSLPNEDRELLRKEYDNMIISLNNTSEMSLFTLSDKIAKLPDFNEILSDGNIRAIVNNGEMDISEEIYRQQGLSYDKAKDVINGIISQDGDIKNWIDQYNRIHHTDYDLNDCIFGYDSLGNVKIKNRLPNELKSAISDAWARATEGQNQYKHVTANPERINQSKDSSEKSRDNEKTANSNLVATKNLLYGTSIGDMDYVCDKHLGNVTGMGNSFLFINGISFSKIFNVEKGDDDKYRITNGDDLTVDKEPVSGYYPVRKNGNMVALIDNPGRLKEAINNINNYVTSRNDVVNQAVFESFDTDMDAKKLSSFLPKFQILNQNKDGDYVYDNITTDSNTSVESIDGISLSSPFGDILFLATIKQGDESKKVILTPTNDKDINEICQNILGTSKNLSPLGQWYLENPEFIKLASALSRSAIQKDENGNYYKELSLDYDTIKELGINSIPCNFWNYNIRMNMVDKNNPDHVPYIYFVDRNGKLASGFKLDNINNFFEAMKVYMNRYENPDNLSEGESVIDYIQDKIFGIKMKENTKYLDWDPNQEGVQSLFIQGLDEYTIENPEKYGEFGQLFKILKNVSRDNPQSFATKEFAEVKGNKLVPVGDNTIKTGDIVEYKGNYYMIITYGNKRILIDNKGNFYADYNTIRRGNQSLKVYKGKSIHQER